MRTMIEEYGLFMVASLAFFAMILVLQFFMTGSKEAARGFVAAMTGSNQSELSDWNSWD